MVRRRELPDTYEEFDQQIAGYRASDEFTLEDSDGTTLSGDQQREVVGVINQLAGISATIRQPDKLVIYPARYGEHLVSRTRAVGAIIDKVVTTSTS